MNEGPVSMEDAPEDEAPEDKVLEDGDAQLKNRAERVTKGYCIVHLTCSLYIGL